MKQSGNFHGLHEPTKAQEKAWLNRITEYAQKFGAFPKQTGASFDRHHVKGRTASHNKIHIGRWFVLPVETEYHHVLSKNSLNVTHFKKRYEQAFGSQVEQFLKMANAILEEDGELPFPIEVLDAIKG